MNENNSNSSIYNVDDEEGATTVLTGPDSMQTGMAPNGMMPGVVPGPMAPNGMMPGAVPGPMTPNGNVKTQKSKKQKPPKQPGGKKKTGLIVTLCIMLILWVAAGAYFLFFTPEIRFERKLAKADEAVTNQNYEVAKQSYEEALEIFDDRIVAINGMINAEIELGELENAREDFEKYRAAIRAFDAAKIEENREEVVRFYAMAGKLFDDNDKLIEVYGEGWELTEDAVLQEAHVKVHLERADAIELADYDAKIEAYTDVLEIDPTNVDALSGRSECAYAVLDDMMLAEQYDEAETFISNYQDMLADADFSVYLEKIASERALAAARHDLMEQVISLMAAGDYEGMLNVYDSENVSLVLNNMEGDSYIYAQDGFNSTYTGKAAGIYAYDSSYYFYYGDYENGIRSGQGCTFVKRDESSTYRIYEGDWRDDKPNGQGIDFATYVQNDDGFLMYIESGSFVDGLYDGEISVTLKTVEGDYTGVYTAAGGAVSDVRAQYPDYDFSGTPEGCIVYVVLHNADSTSYQPFCFDEGGIFSVYGFDNY